MLWAFLVSIFALVAASNVTELELPDQRLSTGNVLPPRKCQMKRKSNVFYSPRASHKQGKIIRSIKSSNESECRASCCETRNCTLYMYSAIILHKMNVSCLLIFCVNKSVCVTKPVPKNATGISFVGIRQDDINTRMVGSSGRNVTDQQINSTSGITSPRSHMSKSVVKGSKSGHHPSNASHVPTSKQRKNANKTFSERRSHTTLTSLIISLIIGIVFFGTLVFLIGRRWGETCFRRGYSRVDYLLNDYE